MKYALIDPSRAFSYIILETVTTVTNHNFSCSYVDKE